MDFMEYIKPGLVVLAVALYGLGAALKKSESVKDKLIPLILVAVGIALATLWVVATSEIAGPKDWALAAFTAIVQGIICAALPVLGNQVYKQSKKNE